MLKSELRKIYLAKQRQLSFEEHLEKSERIAKLFFSSVDLSLVNFLHCFVPIVSNREVDTWLIFQKLWQVFPQVATLVSRVDYEKMTLENVRFSSETKLVFNRWRIPEPSDGEIIETAKIDIVLVPLLAFDKKGFRAGYGKGFYDKLLKTCRPDCRKIGLSYFEPIEKISDVHDFDVPLDFCVTPERAVSF
jgi:5-formyltetrahydrofolate cyclo-ligase